MRENKTPIEVRLERLVRGLTVFSFILLSWTLHRATRPRTSCVSSTHIRALLIENQRVDNCAFESRLRLGGPKLSERALTRLRALEAVDDFGDWFSDHRRLVIEVSDKEPRAFQLFSGALRIGGAWIDEGRQLPRALAMALFRAHPAYAELGHFQIETLADFVTLVARGPVRWRDRRGGAHDFARDVRLASAAPSFKAYCTSPYRSLAHDHACRANITPEPGEAWGLEPLLASALVRTYEGLPLSGKLRVVRALRAGVTMPRVTSPLSGAVEDLVKWFTETLRNHAGATQMLTDRTGEIAMIAALRALDVRSPTQWEVTIDLRHTPRWREIVTQLIARAQFRPNERTLVFTPAGATALPSGLPVEWSSRDVETEKHVIVACHFPTIDRAVSVRARQVFARRTCGVLNNSFWD